MMKTCFAPMRLCLLALGGLSFFGAASPACAAAFSSNASPTNWVTTTAWTPNGVPGAGDNVTLDHDRTFTSGDNRSFGDASNTSVWNDGNITLNSNTVTNAAGLLNFTGSGSGDESLTGTGTFINSSTATFELRVRERIS